ncbi:MAG TPA: hypothetical protein VKB93_10405 [Thermoanaerobaculia bacterium]|nr:hypothetical protein [Thermoanaerobaculia bacterium]
MSGEMNIRRIGIVPSPDWTLRRVLAELFAAIDPVVHHRGASYRLEWHTLRDEPVVAGEDLRRVADVVFDRMTHRSEFARSRAFHFKRSGAALINDPVTFWWIDKYATYDVMAAALDPRDRLPKTVLLPPHGRRFEDEYDVRRWTRLGAEGHAAIDVVETQFGGRWPLFLKKSIGGGGSDVFLIRGTEELMARLAESKGRAFLLQEAIAECDTAYRCLTVGPQVLPMPEAQDLGPPQRAPGRRAEGDIAARLARYARFIAGHFGWGYNSFEAFVDGDAIIPIDFANGCPATDLVNLTIWFPWAAASLFRWLCFRAVSSESDGFDEFVARNFADLDERLIAILRHDLSELLDEDVRWSRCPAGEQPELRERLQALFEETFFRDPAAYLTS